MSYPQNILSGVHFCYQKSKDFRHIKEKISTLNDILPSLEPPEAPQIFQKVLPTKFGGWRSHDFVDLRGIVRKKLEEARANFDVAVGKDFDNDRCSNSNSQKIKTKSNLMAQSAKSYCVYELLQKFFLDHNLIDELCLLFSDPHEKKQFKENVQSLFDNLRQLQSIKVESHKYINKENELRESFEVLNQVNSQQASQDAFKTQFQQDIALVQDRYVQTSLLAKKNIQKLESCFLKIQQLFKDILSRVKNLPEEKRKFAESQRNQKLKDFFQIMNCSSSTFRIDEDVIDFICVREAIENDTEFRSKIVSLIYRLLYDPVSCTDFLQSLGAPGKAMLACLSTRSRLFGRVHSRNHLPDSAVTFFRMLGLRKEDLRLVYKKTLKADPRDPQGPKIPSLELTTHGSFLYQEIENLERPKHEIDTLLLSLFGHSRKQERTDKHGFINSVWDEIEKKWDRFTISYYLADKKVFKEKTGIAHDSRRSLLNAIKKLEFYHSKTQCHSLEVVFENRFSNLQACLNELNTLLDAKNDPRAAQLKNLSHKLNQEVIEKFSRNIICLPEYHQIEVSFLEIAEDILQNKAKKGVNLGLDFEKKLKEFIYQAELSLYYRTYDLKVNQLVKMASSLLQPNGAIRTVIENARTLVIQASEKINNEIKSLKKDESLKQLKKICSDHHSIIALICCHKEFAKLENASTQGSKEELKSQIKAIFARRVSSVFLSKSVETINYFVFTNKEFIALISELVFHKKYSEFAKLFKLKIQLEDKTPVYLTFEELSAEVPAASSSGLLTKQFLSEILKENCLGYEIELDENNEHNRTINRVERALEELNKLFSGQEVINQMTDKLLTHQKHSILKVVRAFIRVFNLSEGAAKELLELSHKISAAHCELNSEEKAKLLEKLDKEVKDNEILADIVSYINKLNTDPCQASLKFKEQPDLVIDKEDDGVGGMVYFEKISTGKSNPIKIYSDKKRGGAFFQMFHYIMAKLAGSKVNQSIKDQLEDEEGLRNKLGEIADEFFESILSFANFIEENLQNFTKIAQQISKVAITCDNVSTGDMTQTNSSEKARSVSDFFANLQQLSRFSVQIAAITEQVDIQKREIANKLQSISNSLSFDHAVVQKSDALSLYCSDECAEAFESTFFGSSQIQGGAPIQEQFTGFEKIKRKIIASFANDRDVSHHVIPIHDANPYRNILQSGFSSFLSMFIEFRLGIYDHMGGSHSFRKIIDLWIELETLLKQEPYYFDGFYFKGSGYELPCLILLQKNEVDQSPNLKELSQDEFKNLISEIDAIQRYIQDNILIFNEQSNNEHSEEEAFHFLKTLKEKFNYLARNLENLVREKKLNSDQLLSLKERLKFIGDIRKFNVYFFQIGHRFISKIVTEEKDSTQNMTQYQSYMSTIGAKLLELRKEFYEIERNHAANQSNLTSFLAFREDFFISNKRVNVQQINQWKLTFFTYKKKWENITKYYFDLEDDKVKKYIAQKFKDESTHFQQVETDLHTAETLFSIYDNDKTYGPLLFSELVLFRFLKEAGLLKTFIKIHEFIHQKDKFKNEESFSGSEIRELRELATNLQSGLNAVAKRKEFNHVEANGVIKRFTDQFSEWFWSSNKSSDMQIQRNLKTTEKLKIAVAKLMDDLVKFAFKHSVFNFNYNAIRINEIGYKIQNTEQHLQDLVEFESNRVFFNTLSGLGLFSLPLEYMQECDKYLIKIHDYFNGDFHSNYKEPIVNFVLIVKKFNQIIFQLKTILMSNPLIKEKFFCKSINSTGQSYEILSPNIKHIIQDFKYQDLAKIFPYPKILDELIKNKLNYFDILLALSLENSRLFYQTMEGGGMRYSIESTLDEALVKNQFKIQFHDNQIRLTYDGIVLPEDVSPKTFVTCLNLKNKAQSILNEKIKPQFSELNELEVPLIYNVREMKKSLENFIIFKNKNGKGGIIYNFSNNKMNYFDDFNKVTCGNEIRVSDSLHGNQSKQVSMYSSAAGEFEYIGCLERSSFCLETLFLRSEEALALTAAGTNTACLSLPEDINFYSSSSLILFNLYKILNRVGLKFDVKLAHINFITIGKNAILLDEKIGNIKNKIYSSLHKKKSMKEIDKIIFDIISQLLEVFRAIKESEKYRSLFNGFIESHCQYNGKNYEITRNGFLTMLLDNKKQDNKHEQASIIFRENLGKDESLSIDILGEEVYIRYVLLDGKQNKRMDSLIFPAMQKRSIKSIRDFCLDQHREN